MTKGLVTSLLQQLLQANSVQEDSGVSNDLHRRFLDLSMLVVNSSAFDDVQFLEFAQTGAAYD